MTRPRSDDDMASPDHQIINAVLDQYQSAMRDYERFWYLGHRFQYHPLVGYVHAPFASESLNISPQGFRGPVYTHRKVHDRPRIAAFGSSALVGIPNNRDDTTMTTYMADAFHRCGLDAEVMNFGLICGRINNEMRMIVKFLVEFDIDAVVLLSGYNDGWSFTMGSLWEFQDIADIQERGFAVNQHADDPVFFLRAAWQAYRRRRVVAQAHRASEHEFRGAERFFRGRRARSVDTQTIIPTYDIGAKIYLQFLHQILAACAYAGKPFFFVWQPNLFTTRKPLSPYEVAAGRSLENAFGQDPDLQASRIQQFADFYIDLGSKARSLVSDEGGHAVDAEARIAELTANHEVFFDECHYREGGNQIIASAVASEILKDLHR